jgi:nicotinamidase-related amidase
MSRDDKIQASSFGGNSDLHGNVPDCSTAALLLIDVINDLNFPKNQQLIRKSVRLAKSIAALKKRCREAGIPTIYINDNHGKWRSEFSTVQQHCLRQGPGRAMVKLLLPTPDDYIVLKPKHSAFYATPLETILEYIQARNIIVAGITTNACVMITASELYVRDYRLFVPSDCVAALTEKEQKNALRLMRSNFGVDTRSAKSLDLAGFGRSN